MPDFKADAPKSILAGNLPQTPLGELTALPRSRGWERERCSEGKEGKGGKGRDRGQEERGKSGGDGKGKEVEGPPVYNYIFLRTAYALSANIVRRYFGERPCRPTL